METSSSRVENAAIQVTIQSTIRSAWEVVCREALNAVRQFVPERWLIDLLVLILAAFLIGVTALYGLAVVSIGAPSSHQPTGGYLMCVREAGPGAYDVCDDRLCCEEMR
jgi:hypothetical protein